MQFRIADTFTDSLAKLRGEEQKSVKTTAFDLQLNPANPGMQFHRLERCKDKNFWSVRVSRDIRIIVHKTDASLLLCYVDHHDPAYDWAARRKLETHPKTGAAQLVEIRESVREIEIPKYVEVEQAAPPKPKLFESISTEQLLIYGVPEEWLDDVHNATEDTLFSLSEHLPVEAGEALLSLACGETPKVMVQKAVTSPFDHPDARRRFQLVTDNEDLRIALEYPWEKWAVFLHPMQEVMVQANFNGPARVSGSAGTGKTIVALHRAVHLAKKYPDANLLVTTFTPALADSLRLKLKLLCPDLFMRIEVTALNTIGQRLYKDAVGDLTLADDEMIREILIASTTDELELKVSQQFIWTEWRDVVDAWQVSDWDDYRTVPRLGRKIRLGEKQREKLWSVFTRTRAELASRNLCTLPSMFQQVGDWLKQPEQASNPPFDIAIVDEAQDLSVTQLRFLASLSQANDSTIKESLFFAGDLGQRIFEPPFSWKSLGVDIRGRSRTLRVNYRTSHQIRAQADKLLPPELADVDGNQESRSGTVSVFNGPPPLIKTFESEEVESHTIVAALQEWIAAGIQPEEIGLFVRSEEQFERAEKVFQAADIAYNIIGDSVEFKSGQATLMTMHMAKGLEFRAAIVMACDDEIVPLQSRIESVADQSDLAEVYSTERHLLYVACTRARDQLLISGVEPATEFLEDLVAK